MDVPTSWLWVLLAALTGACLAAYIVAKVRLDIVHERHQCLSCKSTCSPVHNLTQRCLSAHLSAAAPLNVRRRVGVSGAVRTRHARCWCLCA